MGESEILSKEVLEETINRKLDSFSIKPGTNVGDNYMSVLYSIEAKIKDSDEKLHLLAKCFPSNPARQDFLKQANIFWKEYQIYEHFVKKLEKFASNQLGHPEKLPFPEVVGGKVVNFTKLLADRDDENYKRVYGTFENHFTMVDLRKHGGFRMGNRQKGLDIDHLRLVIKAHAKLHATSWAYKQKHKLDQIHMDFPELDYAEGMAAEEMQNAWRQVLSMNIKRLAQTIEKHKGPESPLVKGTLRIIDHLDTMMDVSFMGLKGFNELAKVVRITPQVPTTSDSNVKWSVVLHGDCWTNNLLFKYDETTGKPIDLALVDLQVMRENCPTLEMAYLLYSSSTSETRKKYLPEILAQYHREFLECCQALNVEPLPGFTLNELTRRFHLAKTFGYFLASVALPIMLKDAEDIQNPELIEGTDVIDVFSKLTDPAAKKDGAMSTYEIWSLALAQELYDEGVI